MRFGGAGAKSSVWMVTSLQNELWDQVDIDLHQEISTNPYAANCQPMYYFLRKISEGGDGFHRTQALSNKHKFKS
jgi:hypothetical protein